MFLNFISCFWISSRVFRINPGSIHKLSEWSYNMDAGNSELRYSPLIIWIGRRFLPTRKWNETRESHLESHREEWIEMGMRRGRRGHDDCAVHHHHHRRRGRHSYDDRRLTLCLALHTTLVDLVGSVAETAQTTSCLLMGTRLLMGTVTCGWGGGGGCCPL